MLNEKSVKAYGKEAGEMLEKLVMEIGEDLAKTCYMTYVMVVIAI